MPAALHLPIAPVERAIDEADAPVAPLTALDTVWVQLVGTVCNLACRHCFISCGPKETRVPMMSAAAVRDALADARRLGARDCYYTGGEPMLHPDFWALCEDALAQGPLTVLTNGVLIDDAAARRARTLFDRARYSFDLRVSLDGATAEQNDAARGAGTFAQIAGGLARLAAVGLSPIVTVVEHDEGLAAVEARVRFLELARGLGLPRPRVKFMPLLRLGREPRRTRAYHDDELACLRGGPASLAPEVLDRLVCTSSRLVAADGVYTCPILLDAPDARLAATLDGARAAIRLRWAACRTCVAEGLSCRT